MKWNESKSQAVLTKYKRRFGIRLSMKILSVIAVLFIIYMIYLFAINMLLLPNKSTDRTIFYTNLAIDWTNPEYTPKYGWSENNTISPLLTKKIQVVVNKRIGRKNYPASELTVTKPFIPNFTKINLDNAYDQSYSDNDFQFSFPFYPDSTFNKKLDGIENKHVWDNLNMIDLNNVATFAFSVDDLYSPSELATLLKPYDIDILWMPLYMGDFLYTPNDYIPYNPEHIVLPKPWGLSGIRIPGKDFAGEAIDYTINPNSPAYNEKVMLENMEVMLKEDTRLAERLLNTTHLQQRYDYVKENGFLTYGAVVTGPIEELQKLQEVKEIRSPYLGDVKPWNWYGQFSAEE